MKRVAWILIFALLLSFLPAVSLAETAGDAPYYICRNFEAGIGEVKNSGATPAPVRQGAAGDSRGALKVTVTRDTGSVLFPVRLEPAQVYQIQVWLKPETKLLNDTVHFIFQSPFVGESMSGYTDITVQNTGLQQGVWTLVETQMRFDGKGIKAGTGGQRFDVTGNGTMEIRLGNGKLADTAADGSSLSFCMDDFLVLPLKNSGNLATGGDFDTKGSLTSWKCLGVDTQIVTGHKGGAVDISVNRDFGQISQVVPIQFGKTYQISFWAKADNEQWSGKNIQVILDRYSSKTDSKVPNYEYLQDPSNPTLTTQWKQYRITYQKNLTTNDIALPTLYFRVGDGKERVRYQIDQVEIVEANSAASNYTMQANLTGVAAVDQVLSVHASVQKGTANKYAYRIFNTTQNGKWVMCDSGITEFDTISYTCRTADLGKEILFEVTGIDNDGRYSNTMHLLSEAVQQTADDIQVLFNPGIWTDETAALSANIFIENATEGKELTASLALYDGSGNLLDCKQETRNIAAEQNVSWNISADNIEAASVGKVLIWDKGTMQTEIAVTALKRIAEGQFVYLDAENGSDTAAGTAGAPLKTLPEAQKKVRQLLESTTEDIYVVLKAGEYLLTDTLTLSNQDSGGNRRVVYTSDGGRARISGGKHVENQFALYDAGKNIYRTFVGVGVQSRQLFVNGVRATRARSEGALKSAKNPKDNTTLTTTDTSLLNYRKISDLELVFQDYWTNSRCGVESISKGTLAGGTLGRAVLTMKQPGWTNMNNRGVTSVTVPAYYENALELLDAEGEWYLDSEEGYLYYKPRYFEDIQTADFVLPVLEKLMAIEGANKDNPIAGIEFHNVEFAYTTWMRPSTNTGLNDAQNNHLRDEEDRLPEAAIEVQYARDIVFQDCTFDRLGITALKMTKAIQNCRVVGNEFYEISGSAISLGDPGPEKIYDVVINPVDPKDFIRNNTISNNYIHHVGAEYQSAAAISAGFPKDTRIAQNEIYDAPYCGMHIGYGWAVYETRGTATENLRIMNNYIHNVLNDKIYDGGAIYTIGATGGTMENPNQIRGNYLKDVRNYFGALYPDEGSMYWKFTENVIDLTDTPYWYGKGDDKGNPRWLHVHMPTIKNNQFVNNFSTTAEKLYNGANSILEEPHVYAEANWPTEALEIIAQAGVSEAFQNNFRDGLQAVTAENPGTIAAGQSAQLRLTATGSRELPYDLSGAEIHTRSRNPNIAAVNGLTVTGVAAGTATIDIDIIEQGMCRRLTVEAVVQK